MRDAVCSVRNTANMRPKLNALTRIENTRKLLLHLSDPEHTIPIVKYDDVSIILWGRLIKGKPRRKSFGYSKMLETGVEICLPAE